VNNENCHQKGGFRACYQQGERVAWGRGGRGGGSGVAEGGGEGRYINIFNSIFMMNQQSALVISFFYSKKSKLNFGRQ
jgi:hypothetical protein